MVNRMIMKEMNNHRIHWLWIICLYKADFSTMLAVHWWDTLHHAEDKQIWNKERYGCRPNRSAITPVFIKEMMLEITRLTRSSLVIFDNDACSCFDRIIVAIISIISWVFRAHKNVVVVWAKTLESAHYHLKTAQTVSE